MDTPILIFTIIGIILWIDSKRRRKMINKAWDFIIKHNSTSTNNTKNKVNSNKDIFVNKRIQLRLDVEKQLLAMGYKLTTDGESGDTQIDMILDKIIGSYEINETPTAAEIINRVLIINEVANKVNTAPVKKEETPDDDAILLETLKEVANEFASTEKKNANLQQSIDTATIALKKLGYKPQEIKKAIHLVISQSEGITLSDSDIVRKALAILNT